MLSNDKSVVRYAISAAVTAYDIDFPFWDFSEIVVTATNSATGASVVLKKDVDYTITVSEAITDPVYQDGTVNMISDTYKSYDALVISRELSLTQDTDYKNGEPINADTLEMSLDRATAQIQQVAEEAGHAMKLPFTEDAGDYTLPEASQRQRKVLGFDSDGKTLVMFSNPDDAIEQANDANAQSSQILQDVTTLKGQAEDAKEAAEEAQGKAEDAQAAAEQAKADTQEIADEAETTIGNSNTTGLRGQAVTAIQTALENALASIGESNSEGARGDAIEAITAALNAALADIGQTDSTGARGEALTAIATALTNALAAIGESNDAGARGAAITAISQALANALNAIGESNSAGARGDAISAIAEALSEALASIGTNDTAGARGAAITAIEDALNAALASWQTQVSADNAALDQKIAGANATIDEKVQDASDSASAAESAKNAAEAAQQAAEEARDEAQAIVDIGPATETKLGLVKISGNARGTATDTAVTQAAMKTELDGIDTSLEEHGQSISNLDTGLEEANQDISSLEERMQNAEEEIDNINASVMLPIPQIQLEKNASNDSATLIVTNNWTGYGSVVVRIKNGSDPTETDPAVPTTGYTITANGNWFVRAFPGEGATNKPSPSACALVSGLRVQRPTMSYNDDTYTVTLNCATAGATIRYTTDGTNPTATTGNVYSGPFTVSVTCTIIFQAYKDGLIASETASGEATVAKIFAVKWPIIGQPSAEVPDGQRLTPSTDPLGLVTETVTQEPQPEITGTQSGFSMFDSYAPWQTVMLNIEADGSDGPKRGEEGFTYTDKDVMVRFPEKGWLKLTVDTSYFTIYLSDAPMEGFSAAPWLGKDIARYETSNNNQSRSGQTVTVSQSINTMRENARAKGDGWELQDLAVVMGRNILFMIEYASRNSQAKIGRGRCDSSSKIATGGTDAMTYHTGRPAGTDGTTAVQYRWIENPWGNVYEWCDGFNTVNGHHYICLDRDNYGSDKTDGYTEVGSGSFGGGYIQEMYLNPDMPWFIGMPKPGSSTGSDTTYFCDYGYLSGSSTCVLDVSGRWSDGGYCGLFFFRVRYTSSYADSSIGSRLSHVSPDAEAA